MAEATRSTLLAAFSLTAAMECICWLISSAALATAADFSPISRTPCVHLTGDDLQLVGRCTHGFKGLRNIAHDIVQFGDERVEPSGHLADFVAALDGQAPGEIAVPLGRLFLSMSAVRRTGRTTIKAVATANRMPTATATRVPVSIRRVRPGHLAFGLGFLADPGLACRHYPPVRRPGPCDPATGSGGAKDPTVSLNADS